MRHSPDEVTLAGLLLTRIRSRWALRRWPLIRLTLAHLPQTVVRCTWIRDRRSGRLLCPATSLEEESILNALARHTSAADAVSGLPDGLDGWRFRRSLGPPGPCRRRPA